MSEPLRPSMAATIALGTKAETLQRLSSLLSSARVLPLMHFKACEWRARPAAILADLSKAVPGCESFIVRSSARAEDSARHSLAGAFTTVKDVPPLRLEAAIGDVFASYGTGITDEDQVLIQPMLEKVTASGVAFSIDPNTAAPYFVINFAEGSDTSAVTGGLSNQVTHTWYCSRAATEVKDPRVASVIALVRELEAVTGVAPLDVEFAFDGAGKLVLFQARPLVMREQAPIDLEGHRRTLAQVEEKLRRTLGAHPYLHGQRTVYGVMPDWNPAEIVGIRPRPLALSLYKEIVTDSIWAYQRHNYGYQNLRSFPLLVDFHGLPYIDVRVSFNSFIPADLEPNLAGRLLDYYVDRLSANPTLHDKVEFEVVFSCYTFDLDERLQVLQRTGFSSQDCKHLSDCLRRLTNRIIHRQSGLWRGDLQKIETLKERRRQILDSALDSVAKIYWLIEDCKRYGTLPFAGLARAGFIAVQMLKSLVRKGVLSQDEVGAFMEGLDTVSGRLPRDLRSLDRATFLSRYGHLRPGTYDIRSPRYDEAPDQYFDFEKRPVLEATEAPRRFSLALDQMRTLDRLLTEHGLEHDVIGLFEFLEAGIRGREYSKFVFSQSLSDAMQLMQRVGEANGFTAEDLSYVSLDAFSRLFTGCRSVKEELAEAVAHGRALFEVSRRIILPPLIETAGVVWDFEMPPSEPNFITQRRVVAETADVAKRNDLSGKIAMITNADPGFDWIFSRGIVGFITAYGGVNSHMAIRASELGLPAVVGAGESLFGQWRAAKLLDLDAQNRTVRVLR